ncbi:hypothetical protein [Ruminococcus callidus]|uniref:hypothetical protein n=2 Tax=Ruminococcus TaxID=1263 RepID=UPI00351FE068
MAIQKNITIDGIDVPFKASAAVPRLYRLKFRRDIYQDFAALQKSVGENTEKSSALDIESLEVFENIAYIMAKHADAAIPASPDEWLEQFNTFSIYEILPQLIDLWGLNVETQVQSKKKHRPIDRPMTTPLFLLRCVQLGLSMGDLDFLTIGLVNDMFTERENDECHYDVLADQRDFDAF